MKKIGFIGFGSMGRMLCERLIAAGALNPEQIIVTRKDTTRLEKIKSTWPGIETTESIAELTGQSDCIFVCVKPVDFKDVLEQMKPCITKEKHMISIAGTVSIRNIETTMDCKITKMSPTLLSEVNEGITLMCHNSRVTEEDMHYVESMISTIGKVRCIDEGELSLAVELTSCAPGFFAALFQEFIESGYRHSEGMKKEDMEEMVLQTLYGTLQLMLEKKMGFAQVISRVATKGGITEEGVKVINNHMPAVFDELFDETLNKRNRVEEKIDAQFQ